MHKLLAKKKAGFTLLELMIVVAILGILAAVAIPAFMTYIKRSKTAEASTNLEKMFTAAATYFANQHTEDQTITSIIHSNCVVGAIVQNPAVAPNNQKIQMDQVVPGSPQEAIAFVVTDPVYYRYSAESIGEQCEYPSPAVGTPPEVVYTFIATGDLDGNLQTSLFSQTIGVQNLGTGAELVKAGSIFIDSELE